jgi:hypothetical protein
MSSSSQEYPFFRFDKQREREREREINRRGRRGSPVLFQVGMILYFKNVFKKKINFFLLFSLLQIY